MLSISWCIYYSGHLLHKCSSFIKDVLNPPDIEFYGELIPGPDYEEVVLSSTEYILESGESMPGPDLPRELFGHTITGINDTHR